MYTYCLTHTHTGYVNQPQRKTEIGGRSQRQMAEPEDREREKINTPPPPPRSLPSALTSDDRQLCLKWTGTGCQLDMLTSHFYFLFPHIGNRPDTQQSFLPLAEGFCVVGKVQPSGPINSQLRELVKQKKKVLVGRHHLVHRVTHVTFFFFRGYRSAKAQNSILKIPLCDWLSHFSRKDWAGPPPIWSAEPGWICSQAESHNVLFYLRWQVCFKSYCTKIVSLWMCDEYSKLKAGMNAIS